MPRNGKGGRRQGTPGEAYTNRTDLAADRAPAQPVRAQTGQTYGDRQAQEQAQQQVPLPDFAATLQSLPALTAPTSRPAEPLTAGLPFGPGPGPRPQPNLSASLARAMLAEYPDPELFALVADLDRAQGGIVPGRF